MDRRIDQSGWHGSMAFDAEAMSRESGLQSGRVLCMEDSSRQAGRWGERGLGIWARETDRSTSMLGTAEREEARLLD